MLAKRSKASESEAFTMLVERVLAASHAEEMAARESLPPHEPQPPRDAYAEWAAVILEAARATPHKFGTRKVFIAGVADELVARFGPDDPAAFRRQLDAMLLELNRRELIRLVRADLVPVMDFDLVQRSELTHMNATFHFVMLE